MNGRLTITEAAKYVGVTPRTIMRWEKNGKIKKSRRDWRGWRFYLKEDMEEIRRFYESAYEYDENGRVVMDITKTVIGIVLIAGMLALAGYGSILYADSDIERDKAVTETSTNVDINLANLPVVGQIPAAVPEASKYTLGPEDIIEIDVRRHPEFSGEYTINSEGKIEYKFVGDIPVGGLTKAQLQEKITNILSEYLIEPEVNVQIKSYLSKVFYVVGEVGRPGKFYMKGNCISILEALVQSGLPTQSAAMRRCRLITPDDKGKENYVYVNVYELLYGGDLKQNLEMKPGDVLYVPSTVIAKIVRIISPVTTATSEAAGAAARGAGIAAAAL